MHAARAGRPALQISLTVARLQRRLRDVLGHLRLVHGHCLMAGPRIASAYLQVGHDEVILLLLVHFRDVLLCEIGDGCPVRVVKAAMLLVDHFLHHFEVVRYHVSWRQQAVRLFVGLLGGDALVTLPASLLHDLVRLFHGCQSHCVTDRRPNVAAVTGSPQLSSAVPLAYLTNILAAVVYLRM